MVRKSGKFAMKFWKILMSVLLGALLGAGCALLEDDPAEVESTPDISLSELEKKMQAARDPEGEFSKAKSFIQKQTMTIRRFLGDAMVLVEVQFELPGKMRVTTIVDNRPATALILNGDSGWMVNYRKKEVESIVGPELERLKVLYQLSNPTGSYRHLFQQIKLSGCRVGNDEFYKLHCVSRIPDQAPIDLYVARNSFLLKRIRSEFKVNDSVEPYDSTVLDYAFYENVMLPAKTRVQSGGVDSVSHVIYNKLNVAIDPEDFLPPVFDRE